MFQLPKWQRNGIYRNAVYETTALIIVWKERSSLERPGIFLKMRKKSERSNKKREKQRTLLDILQEERKSAYFGGIYHKTQIELTYHSNRMDGSRLTHDQARYIFETNTIGVEKEALNVDDVIETANHFRCIDRMIDHAKAALTEKLIKELHLILKMESAIPEKIGLRLAIIKRCRMKSAVWRLHFRKKLPIR